MSGQPRPDEDERGEHRRIGRIGGGKAQLIARLAQEPLEIARGVDGRGMGRSWLNVKVLCLPSMLKLIYSMTKSTGTRAKSSPGVRGICEYCVGQDPSPASCSADTRQ